MTQFRVLIHPTGATLCDHSNDIYSILSELYLEGGGGCVQGTGAADYQPAVVVCKVDKFTPLSGFCPALFTEAEFGLCPPQTRPLSIYSMLFK